MNMHSSFDRPGGRPVAFDSFTFPFVSDFSPLWEVAFGVILWQHHSSGCGWPSSVGLLVGVAIATI